MGWRGQGWKGMILSIPSLLTCADCEVLRDAGGCLCLGQGPEQQRPVETGDQPAMSFQWPSGHSKTSKTQHMK